MNNTNNKQQQCQQKNDSEQGWCVVQFKLDTSEFPQIVKYPRRAPTLPTTTTTKEDVKRIFNKNIEQDHRDKKKRLKNICLSIRHPVFDTIPEHIDETNIYF